MEVATIETRKASRRPAAKAAARQSAPKVKSTLLLSPEASQRLGVHATMLGEDRSALVDRLILDHLKMFKVSGWGKTADQATPDTSES
jgi:hypothetical protein